MCLKSCARVDGQCSIPTCLKLYRDFIMPKTKFEAVFRGFVEDFGGEIVPEEAEDGQASCFPEGDVGATG
jgi:hypothetical protein